MFGTIVMADITLHFSVNPVSGSARWTVLETQPNGDLREETREEPATCFLAALAIAVHHSGTPMYDVDYPAAESVMGNIRWIP